MGSMTDRYNDLQELLRVEEQEAKLPPANQFKNAEYLQRGVENTDVNNLGDFVSAILGIDEEDMFSVAINNNNDSKKSCKEFDGKVSYEEIYWGHIENMSNRMDSNDKYSKNNWKKCLDERLLALSIIRHAKKILEPEEDDPETILEHFTAIGTNSMMASYICANKK
jgi:hypothetical protein